MPLHLPQQVNIPPLALAPAPQADLQEPLDMQMWVNQQLRVQSSRRSSPQTCGLATCGEELRTSMITWL